jgi:hypothetical protein
VVGILCTLIAVNIGAPFGDAQSPSSPLLSIEVLSTRADLVTGGTALVAVDLPSGIAPASVQVGLDLKNVTSEFAMRPNGRFEGLVTGIPLGKNVVTATSPGITGAVLDVTNHPIGGPLFSGPQIEPWVCEAGATDSQCNKQATYSYLYMPVGGTALPNLSELSGLGVNVAAFQNYDPKSPPPASLIAKTTTDAGVTVPFIIRVETGYEDRDQYSIAVLWQPGKPWAPWAPQNQWNDRLVIEHGASCGADHTTGTAPSVEDSSALGLGFATLSTALDNAGHDCDVVTEAESLVIAKEHFVDEYGPMLFTIGTGCSGGSLAQYQIANAYPGIYQGILPQCSFPDAWTTSTQVFDYEALEHYLENPLEWGSAIAWTPTQIEAIEGHPNPANGLELSTLYFDSGADPAYACKGVSAQQRWSPTHTSGVRCDLADYMVNVFGKRPDGYAGRPIDNVGVQYGLDALTSGVITPAQFASLNAEIGGYDINADWTPSRTVADEPALANAYRSGAIDEGNNLKDVAIIDLRGPDYGTFHDVYRSFAMRDRLQQANGTYANQVIWEGLAPIVGDIDYTTQGLIAMNSWLNSVYSDHRTLPLSTKIIQDKPSSIHDQCSDGAGTVIPGSLGQDVCQTVVQAFETPRMVAGESIATDVNKCSLQPLLRTDYYPIQFTDAEWAELESAFPTGVCDWSKPGVSQQPTIPWLDYSTVVGGVPMGPAPVSAPLK